MEILNTSIFIKSSLMAILSSNKDLGLPLEIKNHYIATSVFDSGNMDNNFRNNPAKNFAKKAFDITRALLIFGIGLFILFGEKFHIGVFVDLDPILKYGFGCTCLFYGGFRLYRGIKGEEY